MRGIEKRFRYAVWDRGLLLMAALCMLFAPAFAQDSAQQGKAPVKRIAGGFAEVRALPPGGPGPRTPDGHPDLSGRWYPNRAGRMLEGAYPVPRSVMRQYDPKVTPEQPPMFRPEVAAKYEHPTPYGSCYPGGTPTSITAQSSEHGPMQLIQQWKQKALWVLSEFPQTIRRIPTNGGPHPVDPPPTFNGNSIGRWEGNTLVVDTIAIDTRVRNIAVGIPGQAHAWLHSPQEHVIERFSRPSKNYLTYQLTVIDPVVLEKPFVSVPHTWSLAQSPNDVWTEYLCSNNQEPQEWEKYRGTQGK
jgi:hypothetical protein